MSGNAHIARSVCRGPSCRGLGKQMMPPNTRENVMYRKWTQAPSMRHGPAAFTCELSILQRFGVAHRPSAWDFAPRSGPSSAPCSLAQSRVVPRRSRELTRSHGVNCVAGLRTPHRVMGGVAHTLLATGQIPALGGLGVHHAVLVTARAAGGVLREVVGGHIRPWAGATTT